MPKCVQDFIAAIVIRNDDDPFEGISGMPVLSYSPDWITFD